MWLLVGWVNLKFVDVIIIFYEIFRLGEIWFEIVIIGMELILFNCGINFIINYILRGIMDLCFIYIMCRCGFQYGGLVGVSFGGGCCVWSCEFMYCGGCEGWEDFQCVYVGDGGGEEDFLQFVLDLVIVVLIKYGVSCVIGFFVEVFFGSFWEVFWGVGVED